MMWRTVMIAVLLAGAAMALAQDESGDLTRIKERELEDVRERISALKKSMDASAGERDRLAAELQELEVQIAAQREILAGIEGKQRAAQEKKARLDADLTWREGRLRNESDALAAQVRASYMSGSQEKLRLLLNQQDPASLGRLLRYYDYLNDYRADKIAAVTAEIRKIDALREQVAAEETRLQQLSKERYAELTVLNRSQEGRTALLASLRQKLATEEQEVARLAAEEKDLTRLIAELSTILSDYPISSEQPFSEHKGRLTWPVAGTLLHDYGQPRVGGTIKWNGVVLAAPRGREVRAVYHGRVAFADWLAGMGLLIIIDHGDGYMTLYGYNETLQKNAGDWVAPGDVIATVGDSGGQSEAGLYFELRRGGEPVDVRRWVTRRPGG